MSATKDSRLPLGAVRTADGEVVVPASRRADGSTRKPIRIRQGYVPQDEVPKYKTVAQRRREQEAKRAAEEKASGDAVVDELSLDKLTLEHKREAPAARERPRKGNDDRVPRQERERRQPPKTQRDSGTGAAGESSRGDRQQELKRQLTKINKQLKDIAKLQDADASTLTSQQKQKIEQKAALQKQRNGIIAELNGATVTTSSASNAGPRPKVAISL